MATAATFRLGAGPWMRWSAAQRPEFGWQGWAAPAGRQRAHQQRRGAATGFLRQPAACPPRGSLHIMDGNCLARRAYHGIKHHLINRDGVDLRTVLGFTGFLDAFMQQFDPSHAVVVFDRDRGIGYMQNTNDRRVEQLFGREIPRAPGTMRKGWKQHRPAMPAELVTGINDMKQIINSLGIDVVTAPQGYEADDIIATITHEATRQGQDVVITTLDKDMQQLLGPSVTMLKPKGGNCFDIITEEIFMKEHYGCRPETYPDILALAGDRSDGIPGVKGIGLKKACRLIGEYGTTQHTLAAARTMKAGKLRTSLIEDARTAMEGLAVTRLYVLDDPHSLFGREGWPRFAKGKINPTRLQAIWNGLHIKKYDYMTHSPCLGESGV